MESLDGFIDVPKQGLEFVKAGTVVRVFLDKRLLGWISRSASTFTSPRERTVHYFHKYAGWGISEQLLGILNNQHVETIRLVLKDEKTVLTVKTKTWFLKGIGYKHRSFERQSILPESYFTAEALA